MSRINIQVSKTDVDALEKSLKNNLFCIPGKHDVTFDLSSLRFGLPMIRVSKKLKKTLENYRAEADSKILSVEIKVSSKPIAALAKVMLCVLRPSHPTKVTMV